MKEDLNIFRYMYEAQSSHCSHVTENSEVFSDYTTFKDSYKNGEKITLCEEQKCLWAAEFAS